MNPIELDTQLCQQLPPWYREILDYQQMCQTETAQFEALAQEITGVADNFFSKPWTCPGLRCGRAFSTSYPIPRRRTWNSGGTGC